MTRTFTATARRNCLHHYGCTIEEALANNDGLEFSAPGSPMERYKQQRWMAEHREIGWHLTFPQWKDIWVKSGKWHLRGRKSGCYCMARNGDVGPYSADNVSIQPIEINIKDGRTRMKNPVMPKKRVGSGLGWCFRKKSKKKPYEVSCRGKYVGAFATQAEAEVAYRQAVEAHLSKKNLA